MDTTRTARPLRLLSLCVVLLLLVSPGAVDSRDGSEARALPALQASPAGPERRGLDEEAIRELLARTARANNEGDVDGWLSAFASGAVYMPQGVPAVTDREGLRAIAEAGFGSWDAEIEIVPVEITVSGEWAFGRARVTGQVTSRTSGERITVDNKELLVFRKRPEGGWRIFRMMINANG